MVSGFFTSRTTRRGSSPEGESDLDRIEVLDRSVLLEKLE